MLGLKNPSVLIAGSGPSGIAMAYNLKEVAGMTSEYCIWYHLLYLSTAPNMLHRDLQTLSSTNKRNDLVASGI